MVAAARAVGHGPAGSEAALAGHGLLPGQAGHGPLKNGQNQPPLGVGVGG